MSKSIRFLCIFSFIIFIIFALQELIGGVITTPNNAPLQAHLPNHPLNTKIVPTRIAMQHCNLSKHSKTGPLHCSSQHHSTSALIASKNDNSIVIEKEVKGHTKSEDKKIFPSEEEKEEEEELTSQEIKNSLFEAIINKTQKTKMGKYSTFINEISKMISNDLTTSSNLEKFPTFAEQLLENGSKTVIKLTELENIVKNHSEFFEKAMALNKEEERLIKFQMAGNKLTKEEIKEKLNKIIFEGTNEEKLMKEILEILKIKETEQSLIGTIYKEKIELNDCYNNFLVKLFPNDYDVFGDEETKEGRKIKWEIIEKLEILEKCLFEYFIIIKILFKKLRGNTLRLN
ncbi:unnamed protein product [Meloidogyne enterolobii]|uniref:Uncharacterized protein n=1 Tax=Meloidogyne enterolobii TaxID=390850 RepID=A0ACB0XPV1_MELEN